MFSNVISPSINMLLVCFLLTFLKATLVDFCLSCDLLHEIWCGIFHLWYPVHPGNVSDCIIFVISGVYTKSALVIVCSFLRIVFLKLGWFWRIFWVSSLCLHVQCIYHLVLNGFMKRRHKYGADNLEAVFCSGRIPEMGPESYLGISYWLGWAT